VAESPLYYTLLQNLLEIDFFLIKAEVEMATREFTNYEQVKDIYLDAIVKQSSILEGALEKIKALIKAN
jgi:hypothetical protein